MSLPFSDFPIELHLLIGCFFGDCRELTRYALACSSFNKLIASESDRIHNKFLKDLEEERRKEGWIHIPWEEFVDASSMKVRDLVREAACDIRLELRLPHHVRYNNSDDPAEHEDLINCWTNQGSQSISWGRMARLSNNVWKRYYWITNWPDTPAPGYPDNIVKLPYGIYTRTHGWDGLIELAGPLDKNKELCNPVYGLVLWFSSSQSSRGETLACQWYTHQDEYFREVVDISLLVIRNPPDWLCSLHYRKVE